VVRHQKKAQHSFTIHRKRLEEKIPMKKFVTILCAVALVAAVSCKKEEATTTETVVTDSAATVATETIAVDTMATDTMSTDTTATDTTATDTAGTVATTTT
jgi:predicted nucleic acid binding AN1-type Zn finger protein